MSPKFDIEKMKKAVANHKEKVDDHKVFTENLKNVSTEELQKAVVTDDRTAFRDELKNVSTEELQKAAVNDKYVWDSYKSAKDSPDKVNVKNMEQFVLENGNDSALYLFAKHVPGANLEKLSQAIAMQGNGELAKDVLEGTPVNTDSKNSQEVNMKNLQQDIIENGEPISAYLYAKNIPNANVEALQQVVLNSDDLEVMQDFAENVPGADVETLMQHVDDNSLRM